LKRLGLSDSAIDAAWPTWWSKDADASSSAKAELRFSIARKLGVDPRTIFDDTQEPQFVWRNEAQFKALTTETPLEKAAIASFGMSVARELISATPTEAFPFRAIRAAELRATILKSKPYVRLLDIIAFCWGIGIPIVHTRVFPLRAKRFHAMVVRVRGRHAIILGKESRYPAWIAFHLAHELGHIFSGHVDDDAILVELEPEEKKEATDAQESASDQFALELLTGNPNPLVLPNIERVFSKQLAQHSLKIADAIQIEPGTICLCFGYSTRQWATANGAMKYIYGQPKPIWRDINKLAIAQMRLENVNQDSRHFLSAVLGQ
jgi:Zn-dependent peptidase ImmA (M78 family)